MSGVSPEILNLLRAPLRVKGDAEPAQVEVAPETMRERITRNGKAMIRAIGADKGEADELST